MAQPGRRYQLSSPSVATPLILVPKTRAWPRVDALH